MVLAVTEGSAKSVEIAKRACRMAESWASSAYRHRQPNRQRGRRGPISKELGVEMSTVPEDPAVEKADHEGVAAIDADPDSPAIVAWASWPAA